MFCVNLCAQLTTYRFQPKERVGDMGVSWACSTNILVMAHTRSAEAVPRGYSATQCN